MNKNINFCKTLKGHEGEAFYYYGIGNVILISVDNKEFEDYPILVKTFNNDYENGNGIEYCLTKEGYGVTEDLLLFPSKDQRDWEIWDKENNNITPKTWNELERPCNIEAWRHIANMDYGSTVPIVRSAVALLKIYQLIEVGYGGNVTEWEYPCVDKYIITPTLHIEKVNYKSFKSHIAFHTKEQAEEFLKYPSNVQLLKDYFQINT